MEKKYKTNPNFLLREIGGESVLIPVGEASVLNNSVINLNETSLFLWKQFETAQTATEIIDKAISIYDAPEGIIEKEIVEFINAYLEVGLLEEEKI